MLKDVAETVATKNYQVLQSAILPEGEYPVVSQSANYIEGYSNNAEKLYKHQQPVIVFGDHTRAVKYVDFDFIVGADGVKIVSSHINAKYLFYLIEYASDNIKDRGYGRHFGYLSKFEIPIPPLAEQMRIATSLEYIFAVIQAITAEL